MTFRRVANVEEVWEGDMAAYSSGACGVLLAKCDGRVYAYADRCPHLGMPLSQGSLDQHVLTCAGHHWQYDIRSGRGINPRDACLKALPVSVLRGEIFVDAD